MLEIFLGKLLPPLIAGTVSIIVALMGVKEQNKKQQREIQEAIGLKLSEFQTAQSEVTHKLDIVDLKMSDLSEKVSKHNNLVERMYAVENRLDVAEERQKVANARILDIERDSNGKN